MKNIVLTRLDDKTIRVWSDENQVGETIPFDKITDKNEQLMIALADFLGYEPAHILDFEGCMDYFEDYYDEEED